MGKSRIPTDAEFKAFLSLSDPRPDPELMSLAANAEVSEDGALTFFRRRLEVDREHERQLRSTVVWKWLEPQPDYQRALRAAFRRYRTQGRTLTDDEIALDRAKRAASRLQPLTEEEMRATFLRSKRNQTKPFDEAEFEDWKRFTLSAASRERGFRYELEYSGRRSSGLRLTHEIVLALHHYFGNHAEEHLRVWRKFKRARAAAYEVIRLTSGDIAAAMEEIGDRAIRPMRADRITYGVEKFLSELDRAERDLMPVHRRDATLRERLLLWELNRAFGRIPDVNRAAALHHLLGLDGIEHQLELRNVQRILAGWKKP